MKLYSVTDGYIDFLRQEHPHVYSNKESTRINTRKYIGTVIEMGKYRYFIPLSSPKESDYVIEAGKKHIRKDSFLIFRMISGSGDASELRGTIRIANMIPVPASELLLYDVEAETDEKYKDLVLEELSYLRKHESHIIKRAGIVYKKKISGNAEPVVQYCLDYKDLERMHDEWEAYFQE